MADNGWPDRAHARSSPRRDSPAPAAELSKRLGRSTARFLLSYTGGAALDELRCQLAAPRVAPLYGSVDPEVHRPVAPSGAYRCDLSYLGTYAEDRQAMLEKLLVEPARRLPASRFLIGGSLYPQDFPWQQNVSFILPVGSRIEDGVERPRAVSEYLVERMLRAGAMRICFVISTDTSFVITAAASALRPSPTRFRTSHAACVTRFSLLYLGWSVLVRTSTSARW